jgi:hypothetical protein
MRGFPFLKAAKVLQAIQTPNEGRCPAGNGLLIRTLLE